MHLDDDITPQLEGLQHVGLVDARQALAALARRLEGDMRNALNLRTGVAHGVKRLFRTLELPIGRYAPAAWLAEIDVTCKLSDDQQVKPRDQFGLEARCVGQFRVA